MCLCVLWVCGLSVLVVVGGRGWGWWGLMYVVCGGCGWVGNGCRMESQWVQDGSQWVQDGVSVGAGWSPRVQDGASVGAGWRDVILHPLYTH